MKKSEKIIIISVIAVCVAAAMLVIFCNIRVTGTAKEKIISRDAAAELSDVDFILILGCGVKPDGRPSDMLSDRLTRGCELYFDGAAEKILVSGDNVREDYNEIDPMIDFCAGKGVPAEDILSDRGGVSTYESIRRAKDMGARKIIIVTQKYHLARALYIADALGIDACGVDADLHSYRGQLYRDVREIAARTKDYLKVNFIK